METVRDQIKNACTKYDVDVETACLIADELGFDGDLGDVGISLSSAVFVAEDFQCL